MFVGFMLTVRLRERERHMAQIDKSPRVSQPPFPLKAPFATPQS
eukprot:gene8798-6184_t